MTRALTSTTTRLEQPAIAFGCRSNVQAMVTESPVTIPPSRIKLVLKGPVAERPKDAGVGEDVRAPRQVQGQRV